MGRIYEIKIIKGGSLRLIHIYTVNYGHGNLKASA
jgi:hypothetical protein